MPPAARPKKRDDFYRDRRRRKVCAFCADSPLAGLLDEAGEEDDLKQQVAELAGELGAVAAVERRGDLMRLLEQVGPQIG